MDVFEMDASAIKSRYNQSILKEISPGISLEGLMLKLKRQYFGHLMRRVDLLEKILILEGIGGWRSRGRQRMRWLDGITDSMDMSLSAWILGYFLSLPCGVSPRLEWGHGRALSSPAVVWSRCRNLRIPLQC